MRIFKDRERVAISGYGVTGRCICGDVTGRIKGDKGNYKGLPTGCFLRGSIGRKDIFRRRIGNGYAGSKAHRVYQDRYRYFVPSTITHPNGDASRAKFKDAMGAWKLLPEADKEYYRSLSRKRSGMPEQNIFVSKFMKGEL